MKAQIVQAPENTRFEIAFFDHAVHPLFPPVAATAKSGKVRPPSRWSCSRSSSRRRNATERPITSAALEWARDVLASEPDGPRKLHVFTDFQQSGLA